MNRNLIILGLATLGSVAGVAGVAYAHKASITASCEHGLDVSLTYYTGKDNVDIWVDDRHIVNESFRGTYTEHYDFNQRKPHTWHVVVDGHGENSPDVSGTVPACVAPAPTTTSATVLTTSTSTTTSATVTDLSTTTTAAVPTSVIPVPHVPAALPATGTGSGVLIFLAVILVAFGAGAALVTRRRR